METGRALSRSSSMRMTAASGLLGARSGVASPRAARCSAARLRRRYCSGRGSCCSRRPPPSASTRR
eukprot:9491663-Pyramimonas_sp.AAC.1